MNPTLVPDKDTGQVHRAWPWWRRVVVVLSAVALTLSGYLGWNYVTGMSVIGCTGESACDQVLNSRWSSIGGVLPISGLAAGAYLAMLVASLNIGPTIEAPIRRLSWRVMLVLAGAIAGSAVWFIAVQKWFLGSFCPYCMATHIVGLLLASLIVWQAPKSFEGLGGVRFAMGNWGVSFLGLIFAGALAASQVYFKPAAVYRSGETPSVLPIIDPHNTPVVGSPEAAYLVTLLYDYNCPHCQKVHSMLEEVIRRYDGKVAFVLCPSPLNPHCNPYVPQEVNEFKNSCALARIALAVWVAKRDAFPVFESWMFTFESGDRWQPRTVDAATAKAIQLVGQSSFNAAVTEPWIEHYLQDSIRIYGATTTGGNNVVPKFVFGSRWGIPQPNDVDDLVSILHKSLLVPTLD